MNHFYAHVPNSINGSTVPSPRYTMQQADCFQLNPAVKMQWTSQDAQKHTNKHILSARTKTTTWNSSRNAVAALRALHGKSSYKRSHCNEVFNNKVVLHSQKRSMFFDCGAILLTNTSISRQKNQKKVMLLTQH